MWFKNLHVYRLPAPWDVDVEALRERLARRPLQACGGMDVQSIGWVAPREGGELLQAVQRQFLVALGIEQKLLPAAVVNQFARDRAREIEETQGRRVGRKELREIRQRITDELLPRAFVRRRLTHAWIDAANGWLVVDAAAPAKADELLGELRRAIDELPAQPLRTGRSPAAAMTDWMAAGEAPPGFSIDQDLELRAADEARVRYLRHTLEGEEIRQHIAAGKAAVRLGMTWNDRISFVLTDKLQLKRLAFLDVLKEAAEGSGTDEAERFELDFALMAGELARLLADLTEALGGEEG